MRESELLCRLKRKWVRTTDSRHHFSRYPNLIKEMAINRLNQVWVIDITCIHIRTGFVYQTSILDACLWRVIDYAVSARLDTALTLEALSLAMAVHKPGSDIIHQSDQGVQYASGEYIDELKCHEFEISMAQIGNPYENATAIIWKMLLLAKQRFRRLDAPDKLTQVHLGIGFQEGADAEVKLEEVLAFA